MKRILFAVLLAAGVARGQDASEVETNPWQDRNIVTTSAISYGSVMTVHSTTLFAQKALINGHDVVKELNAVIFWISLLLLWNSFLTTGLIWVWAKQRRTA